MSLGEVIWWSRSLVSCWWAVAATGCGADELNGKGGHVLLQYHIVEDDAESVGVNLNVKIIR